MAILNNGTVVDWGEGEIGDQQPGHLVPTALSGLSGVTALGGGWRFNLAAEGLPKWKVNGELATSSKVAISQLGAITLESSVVGKLKCQNFFGGNVWNAIGRGNSNTEGYTTYSCSSEPECQGAFLTAEPPLESGKRAGSNLPWAGELGEVEKETRLDFNIRLTLVAPCKTVEVPYEGILRPKFNNGTTNGLHPSHVVFEGKGGKTGSLTSPTLATEKEGYLSGELTTSGTNIQLITAG
jgi:hypothetical protein